MQEPKHQEEATGSMSTSSGVQLGLTSSVRFRREFYFHALKKGSIFLPSLSPSFLFSKACDTEISYAVDHDKLVPQEWLMCVRDSDPVVIVGDSNCV